MLNVVYDTPFDYVIFDGLLPFETGFITTNSISLVHVNNCNKLLQKMYLQHKIMELDYTKALEVGTINNKFVDENKNSEYWYNEFAILDNPITKVNDNNFLYQTLYNLQEEYKKLEGSKDTVLTRKNLLDMDNKVISTAKHQDK
jgi:hypothetical protein